MIRTVGVVLRPGLPESMHVFRALHALAPTLRYLVEREGRHAPPADLPPGVQAVDPATIERESDLVVVLGGDGTLIHAASMLQERAVPILGVNMGRIGFLTEVTRDEVHEIFPLALGEQLPHSDRVRLEAELWRDGKVVRRHRILNDAVVAQLALARVAVFRVTMRDELVTVIRGDGVIIATPTGSTAYSLAAGGSILSPYLEAIAITPICPHALTQRPLVLAPEGDIKVTLESDNAVFATLDGHVGEEFRPGDTLTLRRSPVGTRILRVPGRSYFQTLRVKLRWGEA